MSWSESFVKPVRKHEAPGKIDDLHISCPGTEDDENQQRYAAMFDQLQAAKDVAKLLLKSVPGPYIMVRMNGHANGTGWTKPK